MSLGFGEPRIDADGMVGVIARQDAEFILLLVFIQADGADIVRIAFDELLERNLLQFPLRETISTPTTTIHRPLKGVSTRIVEETEFREGRGNEGRRNAAR